jgi:hypothetical protein
LTLGGGLVCSNRDEGIDRGLQSRMKAKVTTVRPSTGNGLRLNRATRHAAVATAVKQSESSHTLAAQDVARSLSLLERQTSLDQRENNKDQTKPKIQQQQQQQQRRRRRQHQMYTSSSQHRPASHDGPMGGSDRQNRTQQDVIHKRRLMQRRIETSQNDLKNNRRHTRAGSHDGNTIRDASLSPLAREPGVRRIRTNAAHLASRSQRRADPTLQTAKTVSQGVVTVERLVGHHVSSYAQGRQGRPSTADGSINHYHNSHARDKGSGTSTPTPKPAVPRWQSGE